MASADNHGKSYADWNVSIELVYNFVLYGTYPKDATRSQKSNIRFLSKKYFERSGQLYYRHKPNKKSPAVTNLLVIRDRKIQLEIMTSMHSGYGTS